VEEGAPPVAVRAPARLPQLVFLLDTSADDPDDLVDADRAAVEPFQQRLRRTGVGLCDVSFCSEWSGGFDARAGQRLLG
jgi:hypothetical protein